MSKLVISGHPLISIPFIGLPSWNKTYQGWWAKGKDVNYFRQLGASMASKAKAAILGHHGKGKFLFKTAMIVVKVYPANEGIMDVFNVNIKAVTDGFTDAGIWADDEYASVPVCLFMWSGEYSDERVIRPTKTGKNKGLPRETTITKSVIEIYELDTLAINDKCFPLPKGRIRFARIDWPKWMHIAKEEKGW